MTKIKKLPDHIITRIAAGEVIERPVYAVKELIENAIDAGADNIAIQVEEAGLKKIVVTDNGEGMSEEDLRESFKPHTTSKITEDLTGIKTLGFRGEALSSIASVSHMTIQSRQANNPAGTTITLRAGEVEHMGPVGMAPGTIVTVSHLFHTVPARKKFLKSNRTELRHIIELVTQYSLSYPEIRFSLSHNGRTIFDFPKNDTPIRLESLLGPSLNNLLLPIKSEPSYITISGFIAHPQVTSLNKQHIFINNRVVSDKLITAAVKEAYGSLLEPKAHPIFVLFLTLPHEIVDVNVHPRKEQVRFVNNSMIYDAVRTAIEKTLTENNLTFHNASFNRFSVRGGTTISHAATVLKQNVETWNVKDLADLLKTSEIIQIHNLYLLMQSPNGFLIIDQHAAHERILYEQFLDGFHQQKKKVYTLEKPLTIELSRGERELVEECNQTLNNLGFTLSFSHPSVIPAKAGIQVRSVYMKRTQNREAKSMDSWSASRNDKYSGTKIQLTTVPDLFKDRDLQPLLTEFLEELSQDTSPDIDHVSHIMIAYLACRTAIKAGDKLTKSEAKRLIERLTQTKSPYTCPHGRPTQIETTIEELNSLFKR